LVIRGTPVAAPLARRTAYRQRFVTHDQEETLEVSHRVAIMSQGSIEQLGTPAEVYDHPANAFVYEFLGDVNLFHERVESSRDAVAYVHPSELELVRHSGAALGAVVAKVGHIGAAGAVVRSELTREDNGQALEAEIRRERFQDLALVSAIKSTSSPATCAFSRASQGLRLFKCRSPSLPGHASSGHFDPRAA
jgi:ABC-type sulfate/molybdate transport systems ATPase subunit